MPPASGTVSSTDTQSLTPLTPLRLPNTESLSDISTAPSGLQIEVAGTYFLSYNVTLAPIDQTASQTITLVLTLNGADNAINGTAVSVRHPARPIDATSEVAMITLIPGNLIQIVPLEITGQLAATAAKLTVRQLP